MMMLICRSHAFEIFVNFTETFRYYIFVGVSSFLNHGTYRLLLSDIVKHIQQVDELDEVD